MKKRRKSKKSGFRKVWFSKGSEKTAGLILPTEKLDSMTISEVSRLYPNSEAGKSASLTLAVSCLN